MSDPESLQLFIWVVFVVVEGAPEPDGLVEVVADVEGGVVGAAVLVVDEPGHLLGFTASLSQSCQEMPRSK